MHEVDLIFYNSMWSLICQVLFSLSTEKGQENDRISLDPEQLVPEAGMWSSVLPSTLLKALGLHALALLPWASDLTSLSLSVLIYEIRMTMFPPFRDTASIRWWHRA